MAEETEEVDVDEKEVIGSPKTPNKDANTMTSYDYIKHGITGYDQYMILYRNFQI